MTHLSEDDLLKFSLDLVENTDREKISNHLDECNVCSKVLKQIIKQYDIIRSIEINKKDENLSLVKVANYRNQWFKRAAIIILGLLISYYSVSLFSENEIIVVSQTFIPKYENVEFGQFISCPNIDINQINNIL